MNLKNTKTIGSLLIGGLLMIACESSDLETDTDLDTDGIELINQDEGFKGTTGNSDNSEESTATVTSSLLFKMHFGADVSDEDAKVEFDKSVENYFNQLPQAKSVGTAATNLWYTSFSTRTDNGRTNVETDGDVETVVHYTTSVGGHCTTTTLNNDGDDREGGTDFYLYSQRVEDDTIT